MKDFNDIHVVQYLVEKLNRCRDEYYNQNKPSIPDVEYDKLFDQCARNVSH